VLNLRRDETAILCLLFLRGPQTPGELRARADRMYSFDGLEAVESTLARLTAASSDDESSGPRELRPLATVLPRQPGSREARYAHLLGGPVEAAARSHSYATSQSGDAAAMAPASDRIPATPLATRVAELEAEVAALRSAVAAIEARLGPAEHEDEDDEDEDEA
jgi:hypothetical protein